MNLVKSLSRENADIGRFARLSSVDFNIRAFRTAIDRYAAHTDQTLSETIATEPDDGG